ncbi:MAG: DUF3169 family protein [Clostridiales bacterium]|nr:DUF3169 family protein [Clostridiales bacterium]
MNKKTFFKMALLMCIGGVIGGVVSVGLFFMNDEFGYVFKNIGDFIINVSPFLYPALLILMFLPAVYLFTKGKKMLVESKTLDEDDMDELEKESGKYLDMSIAVNGVYMLLNFLLLGATIQKGSDTYFIVLFMFLINAILASGMEIVVVRFIQKNDDRIKGDPTSFKFHKDFVASCDEAEQYKIYKSGYEAFQFSRIFTFVMILVSILFKLVFDTDAFPVVLTCSIGLAQVISANVYNFKYANR